MAASREVSGAAPLPRSVNAGRYEIQDRLGSGSFGEVYKGIDLETGLSVAVKFEDSRTGQLQKELSVLRKLQEEDEEHPQGFAKIVYFGRKGERFCLVMECLGRSLEACFRACGGRLSVTSVVLVAQQTLASLEHLHSKGAVHRDVKPENFLCGVGSRRHHLYLIDFGLAEWYWTEAHVPLRREDEFKGTMRYASINAQRYCTQSRRDDLEALGHTLVYFLKGNLPWSGLQAESRADQYRRVRDLKEQTPLSVLCAGLPPAFEQFLHYCRTLGYAARPDYVMLQRLFTDLRAALSAEGPPIEDNDFEWERRSDGPYEAIKRRPQARQPDDPPPPCCPSCMRALSWSDYSEGPYQHGWTCNNFEHCSGDKITHGDMRWYCHSCSNDFCERCGDHLLLAAATGSREGASGVSSSSSQQSGRGLRSRLFSAVCGRDSQVAIPQTVPIR